MMMRNYVQTTSEKCIILGERLKLLKEILYVLEYHVHVFLGKKHQLKIEEHGLFANTDH
jgi:hypothetical protein